MSLLRRPLPTRSQADVPTGRTGARRGFSLTEVLLVMVIFGILVSFAAPRIQSMRGTNAVRSAKQAVSSLSQRVRSESRLRKQNGFIYVNTDSIWYRVRNADGTMQRSGNPLRLGLEYGVTTAMTPTLDSVRYDVRGIGRTFYNEDGVEAEGGTVKLLFTAGAATDSLCITGLGLISACGI